MTLTEFLLARIAEDQSGAEYDDYWTRARMLAECEAKRRIVAFADGDDRVREWWWNRDVGDPLLELLALPYADHPDYRPEWRP